MPLNKNLKSARSNKNGGVVALFKDKVNTVKEIVSTIDKVNGRLSV